MQATAQEKTIDKTDIPVLKGPYFGQKPPGATPEVFAPGIVSIDEYSEFVVSAQALTIIDPGFYKKKRTGAKI